MKKFTKLLIGLGTTALVVGSLAACSNQGGAQEQSGDGGGTVPGVDSGLTIALVTHAAPGDTFWDIVRKGAEDAAAAYGVDLQYASDPDGSRQSQLVQQYVDQGVDGIAVSLAKPDAMQSSVEAAVAADIPVVSINAGEDRWKDMGILAHFGQNEEKAGIALGEYLQKDGYQHPICVIQEQGHVGLEARCAGIKSIIPGTEILYVNGQDMTQVESTVTASLQASTSADIIIGLGAPFALTIQQAATKAGSDIKVGSFDLNADVAQQIKDGGILFGVDQQPYLQGYLAVEALVLNNTGGFVIGGGEPVLTGPAIVDTSNVDAVLEYAQEGKR
ncbi:sugar ABC transporter substrate-binding protein [Pseudoclavibacter chungangensis]|uniref:Sugar ABC transporter substrate-binding protein n=1 Tax=Pseudoclavibacter chungangensis TaxID=587635 RepID=A0A7J5C1B4_9MICO|nr:substrate-binding domain-containing protein [Pseudoclavibacter chungangensis]KAB1659591.1 sugar ABC transporter substrate-binding protein [Pseudoclavibacter chungangensis]NYJ67413.1 simple sugar transport system substrate-binding protein [Pseudoclavibacter chungangensis]